jgi:hypothetical protein
MVGAKGCRAGTRDRETRGIARRPGGTTVAVALAMNRTTLVFFLAFTACGTVDTGEPSDPVDHGTPDGGAASSPDPVPNVAPAVLAVDPPAGSIVDEDVSLAITFSEPMDRASVEAAIEFPGATEPTFTWNPDSTEVTAARAVPYPEGSDPDQVAPRTFEVVVGAAATDSEGEALAGGALGLDYTLRYRRITEQYGYATSLTGNCFEGCDSGPWTWLAAGERSSDFTAATRGFVTLAHNLPDGIDIEHAELSTEIERIEDNPFSFGDLYIDHMVFSAINATAYDQRGVALGVLFARAATPAVGDSVVLDVTDRFITDYDNRVARAYRSQYRIRFPHDLHEDPAYTTYHSDGTWDLLALKREETHLTVTYLIE